MKTCINWPVYIEQDEPCMVCGMFPDNCTCAECSVCGEQGNPDCINHPKQEGATQ